MAVETQASTKKELRVVALSASAGMLAPLVFVSIIVLRKVERRFNFQARQWGKRMRNEIARWS
jgi:hypothetical protein